MLLDELAYDAHLAKRASSGPQRPGSIDVDEIRKRRTVLEKTSSFTRSAEEREGSLLANKDAQWYAANVGDNVTASSGSREESTFFHPTKPPPNGPDGVPLPTFLPRKTRRA